MSSLLRVFETYSDSNCSFPKMNNNTIVSFGTSGFFEFTDNIATESTDLVFKAPTRKERKQINLSPNSCHPLIEIKKNNNGKLSKTALKERYHHYLDFLFYKNILKYIYIILFSIDSSSRQLNLNQIFLLILWIRL